ncbi:M23 family metallopeptidase [Nocardioides bigeumensis]|uniref:M23ase beta-sheet core domain-containing protein n=1 Tax=Nocardioides bigeumensis TaxID=433657 RepID=A0ABN2Y0W3_9ACTN
MGDHRADRRSPRRSTSETPPSAAPTTYPGAGKRAAGRAAAEAPAPARREVADRIRTSAPDLASPRARATSPRRAAAAVPAAGGRRKATAKKPLVSGLPSVPVLAGVATVAIAAIGALSAVQAPVTASAGDQIAFSPASALSGSSASGSSNLLTGRSQTVSRDSSRDALGETVDAELVAEAENVAEQRDATLAQFAQQAEKQAAKIALNAWVVPLDSYGMSAGFGASSYLWSHLHTGQDLSAPIGTPIKNVANGVVTEVGYDGSYGNKTVVTLDDGTEIWYCHQTSFLVSVGDAVTGGEVIGTVGSTGNSTGPHLHIEVRPGGGDPVDPYEAFLVHGIAL